MMFLNSNSTNKCRYCYIHIKLPYIHLAISLFLLSYYQHITSITSLLLSKFCKRLIKFGLLETSLKCRLTNNGDVTLVDTVDGYYMFHFIIKRTTNMCFLKDPGWLHIIILLYNGGR